MMKPNPGGYIRPKDVIGRDRVLKQIFRILERQSLVLTAERRMGKTCILKKMKAEAPATHLIVYHDLEGIKTPLEFSKLVFKDVEQFLSAKKRLTTKGRQVYEKLEGLEVKGLGKLPATAPQPWKELLTETIKDLQEHQDKPVIFLWDELPLMIQKIIQTDRESATELLDMLRYLRQMNSQIRMIYTGSIGLHNILSGLKESGYSNEPINDMYIFDLSPLSDKDADDLVLQLAEGEDIQLTSKEEMARKIAKAVDNIPYYIHHVMDHAFDLEEALDETGLNTIILRGLTQARDAWDMRHYHDRISDYYKPEQQITARYLLDIFSLSDHALSLNDLVNQLSAKTEKTDEEEVRVVLRLLLQDHYIYQDLDGKYCFQYTLIQKWWKLYRGP